MDAPVTPVTSGKPRSRIRIQNFVAVEGLRYTYGHISFDNEGWVLIGNPANHIVDLFQLNPMLTAYTFLPCIPLDPQTALEDTYPQGESIYIESRFWTTST